MEEKNQPLSRKELEEVYTYYYLEKEKLEEQLSQVIDKIRGIDATIEVSKEFSKDQKIYFNVQSLTYIEAKPTSDLILVNIGNEYFQEKSKEEAVSFLAQKRDELNKLANKINQQLYQINIALEDIEKSLSH